MTNYVGSLTTFSLGPSSFSVSEISTITYEGGATPTKASGLSSKKQSLSAGAIFGIIMAVLIGIAAAFFLNACI
ncbi:uncharacterized protein EI90DRAFT_3067053, partial [Cantharellus anzutake]|uniref:uncharacterized protein n=1 Tax=Cantharellus anzutake TaxID=1750568 RepID=UPI0019069468